MTTEWQDIEMQAGDLPSLGMRVYKGVKPVKPVCLVLYLHGGAFLGKGRVEDERPIPRALADAGAVVIEADYGSPSAFAFPHVLDHAFAALRFIDTHRRLFGGVVKSPLFVVGEEAGGNVAAGVALKARDRMAGGLSGQILLSPLIDPLMTSLSIRSAGDIGMRDRWGDGWRHYFREGCGAQHPYAAPCLCSRLAAVAPTLLMTSEDDPLRDEALSYAGRLKAAGVWVREHVLPVGSGWTDIYKQQMGPWSDALKLRFLAFVEEIRTGRPTLANPAYQRPM